MLVRNSLNDLNISLMSKKAKSNDELLKKMNSFLSTIPNDSIEKDTYGDTIEQDLETVKHNVRDNLKSITKMKDNLRFNRTTLNLKKKLNEIENLEKYSSNIVQNIEYKIKRNKIVNDALMSQTLQELAREIAIENIKKFPPENEMQAAVLYENYPGSPGSDDDDDDDNNDDTQYDGDGGFRNRKNKTKNKKYTKKENI